MKAWVDQIIIRPLESDDLPALEWDGEYSHFRNLYKTVYQNVTLGKAIMWGVDLPGTGLIGQLFVQLESPQVKFADGRNRAYIYSFRVKPSYRGCGIGRLLLQRAEEDLSQRNFKTVTLNVAQENHRLRLFYQRLGYRIIGEDPGRWSYIDENNHRREVIEPAWRMEKALHRVV